MWIYVFLEPVGSALPKFSSKDKINAFIAEKSTTVSLMCPAQGHPLPSFRFVGVLSYLKVLKSTKKE